MMKVQNWMTEHVTSAKPLDPISRARKLIEDLRVRQLPVTVNGKLVGIVTDRDLRDASPSVFEAFLEDSQARPRKHEPEAHVEDVMTQNVLTVTPETSLQTAAEIMVDERVGAIPVVSGDQLVGIIANSDIMRAFISLASNQLGKAAS